MSKQRDAEIVMTTLICGAGRASRRGLRAIKTGSLSLTSVGKRREAGQKAADSESDKRIANGAHRPLSQITIKSEQAGSKLSPSKQQVAKNDDRIESEQSSIMYKSIYNFIKIKTRMVSSPDCGVRTRADPHLKQFSRCYFPEIKNLNQFKS